ncbi:MAG: hypothetical protein AB7E51_18835 [Pseudodesulfovibrio sp.]|uniref:hypothetical protein n=1 Tax=Pseudodesulfovibrio sp. TaxID=2035812 RepID=UPI003D0FE1BA
MPVDRTLQRRILLMLEDFYPNEAAEHEYVPILFPENVGEVVDGKPLYKRIDDKQFYKETRHLDEVGFIQINKPYNRCLILTAKGRDFLEDDGGLSAIVNTITVKFDADNVRELVEAGLFSAHVPEEKQGALMKAIREAPGALLQTAVTKMVEKGMSDPVGTAKVVAGLFGIAW